MKKNLVFIFMVVFVLSLSSTALAGPFADVPANNWAYSAVNQLAKAGIIEGYNEGASKESKVITRYEMAILVGKAMEHSDKADATNKALIAKLSTEFAPELSTMGVGISTSKTAADKLQVTGDFRLRGLALNDTISGANPDVKKTYWQLRDRLNFNGIIDNDTTYFARFTNRNSIGGTVASVGNTNQDSCFDNYGIKLKKNSWNFSLGRQDVNLGQGLILNTGSDASGVDNKFDGLVASHTVGNLKFSFIGGKTDKITTESAPNWPLNVNQPTEWYGFDANAKLSNNLSAGIAFAHAKQDVSTSSGTSVNYAAANTAYNISSHFIINAEYDKSNAADQNKAYVASATYKWDRDSFMIQHMDVEAFAVDSSNSGYGGWSYPCGGNNMGSAYKAYIYQYSHVLTKNATFNIKYCDFTVPGQTGSDNEVISNLMWTF